MNYEYYIYQGQLHRRKPKARMGEVFWKGEWYSFVFMKLIVDHCKLLTEEEAFLEVI